jgi:hypothetical protein
MDFGDQPGCIMSSSNRLKQEILFHLSCIIPERLSEDELIHLEAAKMLISNESVEFSDNREERDVPALRFIGLYRSRKAS